MAFSQVLFDSVNKVVDSFLDKVSSKFDISKDELNKLWSSNESVNVSANVSANATKVNTIPASSELSKLTRNELSAQCKARGLKASGTKQELLDRLTGGSASAPVEVVPTKTKKSKKVAEEPKKVINAIQSTIKAVELKKNKFGNFEHSETGFVFDRGSHEVVGKQSDDGKVMPLVEDDIEQCNKFKFKYIIPENLNSKNSKVVVEDILDDEEEVIEEEEEEELLEEEEEVLEGEEELLEEDELME